MAAPGYPHMGGPPMGGGHGGMGGPPMGGPPMGGPPMGGPPMMQRQMRRGTPKIVPIIMSAGLAVGVFCGLLFGVGKKEAVAASEPAKKDEPKPESTAAPAGLGATAAKPVQPAQPAGSAAGSATVAAAGSAAPTAPAKPAVVAPKTIKLSVTLKPEPAMKDAKLFIDGKEQPSLTVDLPADKASVKVEVKSSGYRSVDKKIDLKGVDVAVEFETAKKPSGGTPGVRPPKRPDKPPSGGGGLIDL